MAVIPVVDRLARGADEGAGQARAAPAAITDHRPEKDTPAETTPQPKAHIGGNQVIGFNSSTTAEGAGSVIAVMVAPHEACPHVGLRGSKGHIASRSTPGGPAETMQEATSKCTLTPALDAPIRFFLRKTFGSDDYDQGLLDYDYLTTHQPGAKNVPYAFVAGKLFSTDIRELYARLSAPVWMTCATKGDFANFSEAGWARGRPGWSVETFATRALPQFERPQEFMMRYRAFLQLEKTAGKKA
jgi:hypothetical protein